jgi:hypothetical protein
MIDVTIVRPRHEYWSTAGADAVGMCRVDRAEDVV